MKIYRLPSEITGFIAETRNYNLIFSPNLITGSYRTTEQVRPIHEHRSAPHSHLIGKGIAIGYSLDDEKHSGNHGETNAFFKNGL
ncbi:MAG: hypothetical protein ACLSG8_07240 [Barnesiella sp.]